jgi:hypothetical protein
MAKAIYVCARHKQFDSKDEERLLEICKRLEPDNLLSPVNHRTVLKNNIAFGVMNYQSSIVEINNSLLMGCLYNQSPEYRWYEPLTAFPDGSYALFRNNDDYLEMVTDAVASRTIWYYFDENWFIASTSQRAIVMFLGSFHFDGRVIPWLLSTGSLGPELSWDKRLKRIPVDSSVILDKKSWSISTVQTPVHFVEQNRSDSEHKKILEGAIGRTIESLNGINFDDWVLPLSGGYDSRAILCFSNKTGCIAGNLRTITWGLEKSINETGNDAKVAKDLSSRLGVGHKYYHTNISEEPIKKVIDRFLFCGEGRIDHLSGYMDGMKIWRDLLGDGVLGIIRGDEGFGGLLPVSSELTVRDSAGCGLCSDYSNLVDVIERFGLPQQEFPKDFKQRDESLAAWKDRLYHTYRIPTVLAALSDLKFSYVEVINPLLSRLILNRVRELPDRLRRCKALFKKIVNTISPKIQYASKGANASLKNILRKSTVVELLYNTLQSDYAKTLFSSEFLSYIIKGIILDASSGNKIFDFFNKFIKKLRARFIRKFFKLNAVVLPGVDGNILAFRVYIIIRMHQILTEDCSKISNKELKE